MHDHDLTQLFQRMDAHLAKQDEHLARQDAHLAAILQTLGYQQTLMLDVGRQLDATSRFLAATAVEQRAAMAAMTQLLIQTAERLERSSRREGED